MKVINCVQGSHEWFAARCGKVTASEVVSALAFLKRGDKKGGDTAARAAYKAQLAAEILTGEPSMDGYVTSFMSWGTENEPYARAAYEIRNDVSIDQVGFVIHPTIDRSGASPDGLIGEDGGIEIKCPKSSTHIGYMLDGGLPEDYEPQVLFNLACTGRAWWDFVSFDGRMPPRHQLFTKRVYRDAHAARIQEIEQGIVTFLGEVDELIASLDRMNPELKQAQRIFSADDPELGITDADIQWAKEKQIENERTQHA